MDLYLNINYIHVRVAQKVVNAWLLGVVLVTPENTRLDATFPTD